MDNMSTGVMTSTGAADESGKVMKFVAAMADPMTGKMGESTQKITITDGDNHAME